MCSVYLEVVIDFEVRYCLAGFFCFEDAWQSTQVKSQ